MDRRPPGSVTRACLLGWVGLVLLGAGTGWLGAANLTAAPGDDLQAKINSLNAGDTLSLSSGTYTTNNLTFTSKSGTTSAWITLQAGGGQTPILSNPGGQNMINVVNSHFIAIIGLEISGGGTAGDGVKYTGADSDMLIQDCTIHNIDGVAVNCSSIGGNMTNLTVRHCNIYATGPSTSDCAMYLGRADGSYAVDNSLFERNLIHQIHSSLGKGINLRMNSHGNIVRDNVIFDCTIPCIMLDNTNPGAPNLIERNVCWQTPDNTMQVHGYAIVRNNIIFNAGNAALDISGAGNEVYNNVFQNAGVAVNFSGNPTLIFVNNIVDGQATNTPNGTVRNNYWSSASFGTNNLTTAPGYNPGALNFYPTSSAYIDAGWGSGPNQPTDDFNTTRRTNAPDIGAYELTGASNPGWAIATAFKTIAPYNWPPVIVSAAGASPDPVVNAASTTLSVSALDPDNGPSALTYTWSKVSGPGTVSFSVNGTTTADATTATFAASGTYALKVTVSDGKASVTSTLSGLSVTLPSSGTAPGIATPPANQTVTAGATATFSVIPTGTAPFTYQWQKNSANIGGATGSSYTTPATTLADSGNTYRVTVTNSYGSITSAAATLTVNAAVNPVTAGVSTVTLSAPTGSSAPVTTTFTLTNGSGSSVTVTLAGGQSWLTTSPTPTVTIAAGHTATITVTADPSGLSGTINGTLTLTNSPGGQSQTLPVTLTVSDPSAGASKKSGCDIASGGPDDAWVWLCALVLAGLLATAQARLRRGTG
ncbi:MAG: PKD domain-containing protein [Planctomycetota bacterium]